jgi:hypothetical protein
MTPHLSLPAIVSKSACAALLALAVTATAQAQNITASDNASNYSGGWSTGTNGGTGFGNWTITSNNDPAATPPYYAGAFTGNASLAGITGMSDPSFGLYANPGGTNATVTVSRNFGAPLAVGQTFSFKWATNYDSGDGNKGFNVFAGGTQIVNVNQAGFPGDITLSGNNTNIAYGTGPMTWTFTRTSETNLQVTSSARDGSTTPVFSTNLTISSSPTGFSFYATGMAAGDDRQPYFNDLQILGDPAPAGNRTVTFNVDMSVQESLGNFNSSNGSVIVVGTFNGWNTGNGVTLSNTGNGVYSGNGSIFGAEGSSVQYKFFNTTPGAPNSGYESSDDRSLTLGAPDVPQNIPVVYFSNQLPTRVVTFSVNMSEQITRGNFNGTTGNVSVAGEFNGWSTTANLLTSSGNGIYTGNVTVSGLGNATLSYKFFNSTPNAPNGGFEAGNDRSLVLGNPGTPQILPTETFRMPLPPTITSAATSNGTVGSSLAYQIVTNPAAAEWATSYALSGNTTLPDGLVLNASTGLINGTPTAAGNTTIQLTASNAAGSGTPFSLTFSISASGNAYDSWATIYGLNATVTTGPTAGAPAADPDSDSFTNQQEYAFGTNPTQATAGLLSSSTSGGNLTVTFLAREIGLTYNVQTTDNLSTTAFSNNGTVTGSVVDGPTSPTPPSGYIRKQFTITPSGSRNFYRVNAN